MINLDLNTAQEERFALRVNQAYEQARTCLGRELSSEERMAIRRHEFLHWISGLRRAK